MLETDEIFIQGIHVAFSIRYLFSHYKNKNYSQSLKHVFLSLKVCPFFHNQDLLNNNHGTLFGGFALYHCLVTAFLLAASTHCLSGNNLSISTRSRYIKEDGEEFESF